MTCKVGDWISFYNGGRLVISCVKYVNFDLSGYKIACTDQGITKFDDILEARSSFEQPKLCPVCDTNRMKEKNND